MHMLVPPPVWRAGNGEHVLLLLVQYSSQCVLVHVRLHCEDTAIYVHGMHLSLVPVPIINDFMLSHKNVCHYTAQTSVHLRKCQ